MMKPIKKILGFLGIMPYCTTCGRKLEYTHSTLDKYYIETSWFSCRVCEPEEFIKHNA